MSTALPPRPVVAPPGPWAFPQASRSQLDCGLTVLSYDIPGQHVLSLRLGVPFDLSVEPRPVEGVASLMARTLDEGTTRHTAEELAELRERHGIAWGCGVGERGMVLELELTGRQLATGLTLLAECLTEPTFPDREVQRAVRHRLVDLDHEGADAALRAGRAFRETYFGADQRAGRPVGGHSASVEAVTAPDIRALHEQVVRPRGATLVVAGDLRAAGVAGDALAALVHTHLAPWRDRGPGPDAPATPARRATGAGRTVRVPRPGSVQSELYLGRPGPDRRTPHGWGAYQVLAVLIGGSPQARIDRVLREEKGFTYGIRAGFRPRRGGGLTIVAGAVRADATDEALALLHEVLDAPLQLGEEEVRSARDHVAMTAPARFATADVVADEALALAMDDLGTEFTTATVEQVRRLSAEDVEAAWETVRAGPTWSTAVVGTP